MSGSLALHFYLNHCTVELLFNHCTVVKKSEQLTLEFVLWPARLQKWQATDEIFLRYGPSPDVRASPSQQEPTLLDDRLDHPRFSRVLKKIKLDRDLHGRERKGNNVWKLWNIPERTDQENYNQNEHRSTKNIRQTTARQIVAKLN